MSKGQRIKRKRKWSKYAGFTGDFTGVGIDADAVAAHIGSLGDVDKLVLYELMMREISSTLINDLEIWHLVRCPQVGSHDSRTEGTT